MVFKNFNGAAFWLIDDPQDASDAFQTTVSVFRDSTAGLTNREARRLAARDRNRKQSAWPLADGSLDDVDHAVFARHPNGLSGRQFGSEHAEHTQRKLQPRIAKTRRAITHVVDLIMPLRLGPQS